MKKTKSSTNYLVYWQLAWSRTCGLVGIQPCPLGCCQQRTPLRFGQAITEVQKYGQNKIGEVGKMRQWCSEVDNSCKPAALGPTGCFSHSCFCGTAGRMCHPYSPRGSAPSLSDTKSGLGQGDELMFVKAEISSAVLFPY